MSISKKPQKTGESFDQDGFPLQFDVREDEEQNVKFEQIVDLLLAAGYFRARIKMLSPFDKVVGGMAWCITTCSVGLDVDLLFQENATIGQKIALTEKIVAVLPLMKCPHRIEPHQIQGLDFIHIYPVVQWLVKKAIETREETGNYVRSYAVSQFDRQFKLPQDMLLKEERLRMSSNLSVVKAAFMPQRKLRKHEGVKFTDEDSRIQSTLLEYGQQHYMNLQQAKGNESEASHPQATKGMESETQLSSLMSGLVATKGRVAAATIGSIVGEQSSQIQQFSKDYHEKKYQLEQMDKTGLLGGVKHQERLKQALEKQIKQAQDKDSQVKKLYEEKLTAHQGMSAELQEAREYVRKLTDESAHLDQMETQENKELLETLRQLIALNETLKKQEQEFKSQCKEELARLNGLIESLKSAGGINEDDQEMKKRLDEQHESDRQRLHKIRLLMAKKNREIVMLQRRLDEVPSRAELSQYQKRFFELYDQVAATHKETKQFYTMYNTLDDTKLYLEKEINLLNSVHDTYTQAMSSASSKQDFLKQLEKIVENVQSNSAKLAKKREEEKSKRDDLNNQHVDLVEKERLYYKTVRDFQEECRRNEALTSQLRLSSQQS